MRQTFSTHRVVNEAKGSPSDTMWDCVKEGVLRRAHSQAETMRDAASSRVLVRDEVGRVRGKVVG